jgi:hypothetical protein
MFFDVHNRTLLLYPVFWVKIPGGINFF